MALTKEKVAFIKKLVDQGIVGPGPVQTALKQRFGSGVAPRELAPLIRGRGKTKPRPSRERKKPVGRPRAGGLATSSEPPKRRGRPRKQSATAAIEHPLYLVTWRIDGTAQTIHAGSTQEAEQAVQVALDQGAAPPEVAVYEKASVRIEMKVRI